jgi:hypothetical protein
MGEIEFLAKVVQSRIDQVDLRIVPRWVRAFFHPETLREIVAWTDVLKERGADFLFACLLGILHHQRPGFLSYPSSHTVPYLRTKRFPRHLFPKLYGYRSLRDRLERKVLRALKRQPEANYDLGRLCYERDASTLCPSETVDCIISSPPYMWQLDYARDNRLRLWFVGVNDWKSLDASVSPSEEDFLVLITSCLVTWHNILAQNGYCILVLGDTKSKRYKMPLPQVVAEIATKQVAKYTLIAKHSEPIPNRRRVRRGYCGSKYETILVFQSRD